MKLFYFSENDNAQIGAHAFRSRVLEALALERDWFLHAQ